MVLVLRMLIVAQIVCRNWCRAEIGVASLLVKNASQTEDLLDPKSGGVTPVQKLVSRLF